MRSAREQVPLQRRFFSVNAISQLSHENVWKNALFIKEIANIVVLPLSRTAQESEERRSETSLYILKVLTCVDQVYRVGG